MDQTFLIYHYVSLGIAFLPAIIGVVLIWTGIIQVLMAESDDKVLQGVMGVVTGPLMFLAVLLKPLAIFFPNSRPMMGRSYARGRRARPGEIPYPEELEYEEYKRRDKGPYGGGARIGIGIILIIFVYFAWEILLYIALGLLFLFAHIISSR